MGTPRDLMVRKLDYRNFTNKFDSHWEPKMHFLIHYDIMIFYIYHYPIHHSH